MSKIVHVMLACFYKNGFGYQENILPAKHKELGYDVRICTYNQGGDASYPEGEPPLTYTNPDGIPVHVLESVYSPCFRIPMLGGWLRRTKGIYKYLESEKPDIIFIHGVTASDNLDVIRYKRKHPEVKLYADNHSDYYNAPVKTFRQKAFRYSLGRFIGKQLSRYAEKVWGVTPWRVIYQQKIFGVNPQKSQLLVMGGNEKLIHWDERTSIRTDIRKRLSIPENAFVVISGGKIDKAKNLHLLADAIKTLPNVYLILFGRFEKDMDGLTDVFVHERIKNIGWISPAEANDYFLASDLGFFPGTHSVLWEQACATGLPSVFKDWEGGFNHVDVGGNCILLKDPTTENITSTLSKLLSSPEMYQQMKNVAETTGRKTFSYIEIAKKSIGIES